MQTRINVQQQQGQSTQQIDSNDPLNQRNSQSNLVLPLSNPSMNNSIDQELIQNIQVTKYPPNIIGAQKQQQYLEKVYDEYTKKYKDELEGKIGDTQRVIEFITGIPHQKIELYQGDEEKIQQFIDINSKYSNEVSIFTLDKISFIQQQNQQVQVSDSYCFSFDQIYQNFTLDFDSENIANKRNNNNNLRNTYNLKDLIEKFDSISCHLIPKNLQNYKLYPRQSIQQVGYTYLSFEFNEIMQQSSYIKLQFKAQNNFTQCYISLLHERNNIINVIDEKELDSNVNNNSIRFQAEIGKYYLIIYIRKDQVDEISRSSLSLCILSQKEADEQFNQMVVDDNQEFINNLFKKVFETLKPAFSKLDLIEGNDKIQYKITTDFYFFMGNQFCKVINCQNNPKIRLVQAMESNQEIINYGKILNDIYNGIILEPSEEYTYQIEVRSSRYINNKYSIFKFEVDNLNDN